MLENIKEQYKSRKVLIKQHYYAPYKLGFSEQFRADIYPAGLDYYHELNPLLLLNIASLDHLNQFKTTLVRDGAASFSSFLMKNFQAIPKLKTHFIIHPHLARLVPANLRSKFSCWNIYQPNQLPVSKAKKIFITCPAAEHSTPPLKDVRAALEKLKTISPDCEIDLFIPNRKSPFTNSWKESYLSYELVALIKEMIPNHKLTFLTAKEVLEISSWKGIYCLDLLENRIIISDNYLNYHIASRGGTISSYAPEKNDNPIFQMALSFYHHLQIIDLPECDNMFAELIFYKKQSSILEHLIDPKFYQLLKENNF